MANFLVDSLTVAARQVGVARIDGPPLRCGTSNGLTTCSAVATAGGVANYRARLSRPQSVKWRSPMAVRLLAAVRGGPTALKLIARVSDLVPGTTQRDAGGCMRRAWRPARTRT